MDGDQNQFTQGPTQDPGLAPSQQPAQPGLTPAPMTSGNMEPPKNNKKTLVTLIVAIVVLLLLGGGVFAYKAMQKSSSNRADKEDSSGQTGSLDEENSEANSRDEAPASRAVPSATGCYTIEASNSLLRDTDTKPDTKACTLNSIYLYSQSSGFASIEEAEASVKVGKTPSEEVKEVKRITVNGKQALWVYKQQSGLEGNYDGDKIVTVHIDAGKKYNISDQVLRNMFTFTFYDIQLPEQQADIDAALNSIKWL